MKKGISKPAVIGIGNAIIVLICFILLLLGVWKVLSDRTYDYNLKQSMTGVPNENIVVIGIDSESIKSVGPYPWDRKVYAELINILEKAGAKVIGFDIELYTNGANAESDKLLSEELARHNNIVLPSHAKLENEFNRSTRVKEGELITAREVEQPIPMFRTNEHKAHINAAYDTDGMLRSNWLQINTPEGIFPSMGLAMAQLAGSDVSKFENVPPLQNRPRSEMLIKWDALEYQFETISFARVLKGTIPPQTFKDRIVLVGYAVPGSDEGVTPIERHMHLVYAHANILNQILNQRLITPVSGAVTVALAAFIIAILGFLTWRLKAIAGIVLMFGVSIALLAVQYLAFAYRDMYIDTVGAIACGWIAYLGNIAMKTYFETKQKMYITQQFGRYLSPDVVQEIASGNSKIKLGGISKNLTVLFLDVRGFTSLSERLKPEEVVDVLNKMFDLITEQALNHHGTIDKFIGDAAMILYNAPLDVADHPYYAVKTAYEIQKGMERVRAEVLDKYGVSISAGIGINTGDVVVGNIGSFLRVDYTAIGDHVNIAARIESSSEPNQILVSQSTYEQTSAYFEYSFVGEKLMKGKSIPLKLYEVKEWLQAP